VSRRLDARADPAAARAELARTVAAGGVAVFPADGLYGLACDPLRAEAIARIHEIKGREERKPSAVLYFSTLAMRELLPALGPRTREAVAALLPGPLTLVVANRERRYPLACRADPERLGLRLLTEHPLAGLDLPLLQSSANLSGAPPPAALEQLDPRIAAGVDLLIDAGELGGQPSTVVDLGEIETGGEPLVLREGALSGAALERSLAALR
jgi:L-threonylcarbamoyladenylate synthase